MIDTLIVGAGLTGSTCAHVLSTRGEKVVVLDVRPHIGGLCADHAAGGSYIHDHGPHIFHTRSATVMDFLQRFSLWTPYVHRVTAQVEFEGRTRHLPFPYSDETAALLGRPLEGPEVIDLFFKGYTEKMWGVPWERLPLDVQKRVPQRAPSSTYFVGQTVALPAGGYTQMFARMLDGLDVRLGVAPNAWLDLYEEAQRVIYTGRIDLLPGVLNGEPPLKYRTLQFTTSALFVAGVQTPVLNFCHRRTPYTRITSYGRLTGGDCRTCVLERPLDAQATDPSPLYTSADPDEWERHKRLLRRAHRLYPKMVFAGRLANYRYLDMTDAIQEALNVVRDG